MAENSAVEQLKAEYEGLSPSECNEKLKKSSDYRSVANKTNLTGTAMKPCFLGDLKMSIK
jgi:hypothetical protein